MKALCKCKVLLFFIIAYGYVIDEIVQTQSHTDSLLHYKPWLLREQTADTWLVLMTLTASMDSFCYYFYVLVVDLHVHYLFLAFN